MAGLRTVAALILAGVIIAAGLQLAPQIVDQLEEWLGPEDVDQDIGANITYRDIPHAYIVTASGGSYRSANAVTGEVLASGTSAATVIQTTLNALTFDRAGQEAILLQGTFAVSGNITVDSLTIIQLEGTVSMAAGSTASILTADGENGITVDGGRWYGSSAAAAPFYFEDCTDVEVLADVHDSAGAGSAPFDYAIAGAVVLDDDYVDAYTATTVTNALQWAAGQSNSEVYVPAGTYSLGTSITPVDGVTIMGDGATSTVFTFTTDYVGDDYTGASFLVLDVDDVTLKQFGITGEGCIRLTTTSGTHGGHVVEDVTIWDTNFMQPNAFGTWVKRGTGAVMDDVKFIRCEANNVGGNGFGVMGDFPWSVGSAGTQKNIYFEDCKALYCGYVNSIWDWTVGFDLNEQCIVDTLTLTGCEASYNWESGFHFEYGQNVANVTLTDCVANYNGQAYSDPRGAVWGAGYLSFGNQGVVRTNCTGTGSAGGTSYTDDRYTYEDKGNGYTYLVASAAVKDLAGTTVYTGSSFSDALQWACGHADAVVKVPGGTYSVNGRIALASGVTLYGGLDTNEWFADAGSPTILNFGTGADQGFLIDDASDVHMDLLRINYGNLEIVSDAGTSINDIALRGLWFDGCTAAHAAAISVSASSGSSVSGLDMGACSSLDSTVDGYKSTGTVTGTTQVLCDWSRET